jgi:hypothetical protein
MFGNRDDSVHILLYLVTVTVLSLVIDECVYGSSLRNLASHAVLALQQIFAVTDRSNSLPHIYCTCDAISFRSVDDTPRQTISILYERNTIDSSIEPCSAEDEFCCKRADVVLCCPNFQQSALLIVSSLFQFSEHVSVSNEDSDCQCPFVLFFLNKLGTIHTCCID